MRYNTTEKAIISNYALNHSVSKANKKYGVSKTSIYNWINYGYEELYKIQTDSDEVFKQNLMNYITKEPQFTKELIDNIMRGKSDYKYKDVIKRINKINENNKWNLITWIPDYSNTKIPSKNVLIKSKR